MGTVYNKNGGGSGKLKVITKSGARSYSFTEVKNYKNLTIDNFKVAFSSFAGYGSQNTYTTAGNARITSWNANTGVLNIAYDTSARTGDTASAIPIVYCFYIE